MAGGGTQKKTPIRFRALEKVRIRPPSLVQICLKRVAANFLQYDNLHQKLVKKQLEDVFAMLDLDMPLPEAANRINDENYWKARTQARHRNAQVEKHGNSWKQTFLELELQDKLEKISIDYSHPELEALKQQVIASKLHVYQLHIGQFPSHLDLSFIFDSMPALCSFGITYGNRRLGMEYERAMFGMKISDAQWLARNIRVSQTLCSLSLPCNMIDDELVKVLMGGLSYGHMLTNLDLSHNKIGDRGARRLASLLDPDYCLQKLNLSDNQIHANGCMHLGAHLAENITCEDLNLRLNRCEDNGISHLFQDLCVNKYLKNLNISSNDLTVRCLPYMNSMISENTSITDLDLSANPLYTEAEAEEERKALPEAAGAGEESSMTNAAGGSTLDLTNVTMLGGSANNTMSDPAAAAPSPDAPSGYGATQVMGMTEDFALQVGIAPTSPFGIFARCLMRSPVLLRVDVRHCGLPEELYNYIITHVKHRELRSKGIPVEAYEKSKQQAKAAAAAASSRRTRGRRRCRC
jgi:hypothetical protein